MLTYVLRRFDGRSTIGESVIFSDSISGSGVAIGVDVGMMVEGSGVDEIVAESLGGEVDIGVAVVGMIEGSVSY